MRRGGADLGRGPHPARNRWRARSSATSAARWPSRSARRSATERRLDGRGARWNAPRLRVVPRRAAGRRAGAPRSRVFQRPRRIQRRRPRVRHHDFAAASATPAPWVNVLANPHFGTVVSESGLALHLERERARVPPHAVAQRPGERRERRGLLPARRGERPLLVADAAALRAAPAPYVTRHGFGYSVFEHTEDGIRSELCVYVAPGCGGQVLGAEGRQRLGPAAPALRHRLCRVGARRPAAEDGDARGHRDRSGERRAATRAMPTTPSSPAASAFFDVDDATRTRERRPHRVPRPQRHAWRNPAAMRRARLSDKVGRGARSLRRDAGRLRARRRAGARDRLHARRRRDARAQTCAALPRTPRAGRSKRCGSTGSARSARCRWKRPTAPFDVLANGWLALPDAGVPPVGAQRLLPVGRRVRLPRSAAGRDGAGARRAAPRSASTCCAARRTSSARATCSTGGIRPRAAACARIARTITSGCPGPRAATC